MESLDGSINVDSVFKKGTTFSIQIGVKVPSEQPSSKPVNRRDSSTIEATLDNTGETSGKNVLSKTLSVSQEKKIVNSND